MAYAITADDTPWASCHIEFSLSFRYVASFTPLPADTLCSPAITPRHYAMPSPPLMMMFITPPPTLPVTTSMIGHSRHRDVVPIDFATFHDQSRCWGGGGGCSGPGRLPTIPSCHLPAFAFMLFAALLPSLPREAGCRCHYAASYADDTLPR